MEWNDDARFPSSRVCMLVLGLASSLLVGCAGDLPRRIFSGASAVDTEAAPHLAFAVDAPSDAMPVTAGLYCRPVDGSGDEFEVWIKVRIANGYYLHAVDEAQPELIAVSADLDLSDAAQQLSAFEYPEPIVEDGHKVYRDELLLRARIQRSVPTAKRILVKATLKYQACSSSSCQAPEEVTLTHEL